MDERQRLAELTQQLASIDLEILRSVERRARLAPRALQAPARGRPASPPVSDGAHLAQLEKAVNPAVRHRPIRPRSSARSTPPAPASTRGRAPRVRLHRHRGRLRLDGDALRAYFDGGAELVPRRKRRQGPRRRSGALARRVHRRCPTNPSRMGRFSRRFWRSLPKTSRSSGSAMSPRRLTLVNR